MTRTSPVAKVKYLRQSLLAIVLQDQYQTSISSSIIPGPIPGLDLVVGHVEKMSSQQMGHVSATKVTQEVLQHPSVNYYAMLPKAIVVPET